MDLIKAVYVLAHEDTQERIMCSRSCISKGSFTTVLIIVLKEM